jgi:hypothetical protein
MALDTRDKLVAAVAGGFKASLYCASIANQLVGGVCSLWRGTGSPLWGGGAIPTTFATCDDNLAGGIVLPAFGTNKGYITRFAPCAATIGTFNVYDRLAHLGGLVGNVATVQAAVVNLVTAAAAGRCAANGEDVQWFLEWYAATGSTAVTASIIYKDPSNTDRTTTIALPATVNVSRCSQIIPLPGYPITSIVSVTLSATTGTAGNFGVTARKYLTSVGVLIANVVPPGCDGLSLGLPEIKETSCLEMLVNCSATSTGLLQGSIQLGYA